MRFESLDFVGGKFACKASTRSCLLRRQCDCEEDEGEEEKGERCRSECDRTSRDAPILISLTSIIIIISHGPKTDTCS